MAVHRRNILKPVVPVGLAGQTDVCDRLQRNRLLIHKLGEGWEPLCAHLGVAVPAEPYPFRNTTAQHNKKISAGDGTS